MQNPFFTFNAAAEELENIKKMRVDREVELQDCITALVGRHHNILLYGERGAGKTFLLRVLENELSERHKNIHASLVSLGSLGLYGQQDDLSAFPRAVLLQLCRDLWTKVVGKSYLDLKERLEETGQEITLRNNDEIAIQRVYTHLMAHDTASRRKLSNSVGFSAIAKGEKSEERYVDTKQFDLLPFEFGEYTEELRKAVLLPRGITKVVLLCDEANHMSVFRQELLLEKYLELFGQKRVQFLFVAGQANWLENDFLPCCFETTIELKGFSEKSNAVELINKVNTTSITFSTESIDTVYEAFKGHPRLTLMTCAKAFDYACEIGESQITASTVFKALRDVGQERRRWNEMAKRREVSQS
ncbi:MAG: hypothetical protein WC156_14625 [Pedobacter sp.]